MDYLKIAIMNNSGNVGKSMVCDTLFFPRINNAKKIKIETINSDGTNDETIAAKNIQKVFELIDSTDVALIDVGASNIENFMSNLKKLEGAHEEIDFFFVPTTPKPKQQLDTITTINDLLDLGVEPEQIKLIFNFYDPDYPIEKFYSVIFESDIYKMLNLKSKKNIFTINENPVFDMLGEMGVAFTEIANDERDFKSLIRATKDQDKRAELSHQRSAYRLAQGFVKELDITFERINASCAFIAEKVS
jgi:hypothetical protein